jgi:hypothetical protein
MNEFRRSGHRPGILLVPLCGTMKELGLPGGVWSGGMVHACVAMLSI